MIRKIHYYCNLCQSDFYSPLLISEAICTKCGKSKIEIYDISQELKAPFLKPYKIYALERREIREKLKQQLERLQLRKVAV